MSISVENSVYDRVSTEHYIDDGCKCCECESKRKKKYNSLLKGEENKEKIRHDILEKKSISTKLKEIKMLNKKNVEMSVELKRNINGKKRMVIV